MRALVTAIGLGANRPQDAVYPTSLKDANGSAYDGANKYVMRFDKGQTPPVEGFWSMTMYNEPIFLRRKPDQSLFDQPAAKLEGEPGRIGRYLHPEKLAGRRQGIELAACSRRTNSYLMLRMYWPNENDPSILDGSWTIPPVTKAS